VVIPTWDKTLPTVIGCLDATMRRWEGCPTYWLTDNEKTVTVDHVAGIPVRHPLIVAAGKHYGVTIATCVPADPESKGGAESTVKLAKADIVPTDHNLRDDYATWAELVEACEAFMNKVNNRDHRITRRPPVEMLGEERLHLHRLPERAFTVVFGESRRVSWSATINYHAGIYSVPHTLADAEVWVRADGNEIVITHIDRDATREVARHLVTTPGTPRICDEHYPPRPPGPLGRQPRATNRAETDFLDLGEGARMWLLKAAAEGAARVNVKMADTVTLARLHGPERVDWALGHAATHGRFAEGDLAAILAANPPGQRRSADETHSMQPSTKAWDGFGTAS
jgi:hypothetical protein